MIAKYAGTAVALASLTAFCAIVWWPAMFLVWAAAGIEWTRR